jgi:hypothetical protein
MAKLRLALIIAGSAIALLAAAFTLLVAFRPFQPEADSPLAGIYNAVVGSLSISPAMRSR